MQTFTRWVNSLEHNNRKTYWISYCLLFLVMFLLMGAGFFLQGKGFIWIDDGLEQQYTVFVQYGEWLRQIAHNIFVDHSFVIPLWDTQAGYGQDMPLSMISAIGNPINLLAVFSTATTADFLLQLTVPITLFLAGLAFSGWALYRGNDGFSTLIACMVFVFSGYSLISFAQIYMIYPLVYTPLVVWGVDKIFNRESPALFVASMTLVFLYAISDGWAVCLLLVLYCVVKFALLDGKKTVGSFFKWFLKIFALIVLAALISAILLVPNAVAVLTQERVSLDRGSNLFYSTTYYVQLFQGFIGMSTVGSECFYGYMPIALLALLALIVRKKGTRAKFVLGICVLLFAFLLLPLFGRIFNGFAYPNNRWVYAFSLALAYVVMKELPLFAQLAVSKKRLLVGLSAAYLVLAALTAVYTWHKTGSILVGFGLSAIIVIILDILLLATQAKKPLWKFGVLCSVIVACGCTYFAWTLDYSGYYLRRQVNTGASYETLIKEDTAGNVATLEGTQWRYDAVGSAISRSNVGTVLNKDCLSFYNSYYNDAIDNYHSALGLSSSAFNITYSTLQGRTIMEQFAGIRYIVAPDDSYCLIPTMYRSNVALTDDDSDYKVYEANEVLPMAYLYSNAVPEEVAATLDPITLQEAMTQVLFVGESASGSSQTTSENTTNAANTATAITTDAAAASVTSVQGTTVLSEGVSIATMNQSVPFSLTVTGDTSGAAQLSAASSESTDETISAVHASTKTGGAVIHLDITIPAGKECSLVLQDVLYSENPDAVLDGSSATSSGILSSKVDLFSMLVKCEGVNSAVSQSTPASSLYSGKNDWVVNLGTSDQERNGIDITLKDSGAYVIGNISVKAEDTQAVEQSIKTLCANAATNITFKDNTFTCTAQSVTGNDYVLIRLPYSDGWSALVDGVPTEILSGNIGFIAIPLSEGTHEIVLNYCTPGLRAGAVLSVVGIIIAIVAVIVRRRVHRPHSKQK